MNLPTRHMLFGISLGALCASALAAMGPGYVMDAIADEMPAGFDTGKLVKFDDRDYRIDYEDWVSTDPVSSSIIKKIEGGRVSYVNVATTATGTYSSDSLISKHVLYPGIEVNEVAEDGTVRRPRMAFWTNGSWYQFASRSGNSILRFSGRHVGY